MKWLAGCDPIGCCCDKSISAGYVRSISDSVATSVSAILKQTPYGCAVEVDKGFLIKNDCALLGMLSIRPMKMLDHQKQDAGLTQKVGKIRITVEPVHGGAKQSADFFSIADRIFRSTENQDQPNWTGG